MKKAAKAQLVKLVLTSVVTYHATVFNLLKWLIKKIDKLRRNFFWKGEEGEGNKGGACLVKQDEACRPKDLGNLGIHDLKCFGRTLIQRWFWYHWTDDSKPWQGMSLPCDEQDKALFQTSIEIKIGNGKKASFWQDNWLETKAPKDIVSLLYNLDHFKRRMIEKDLHNNNWIHVVCHISTREELLQFVSLWSLLRSVSINQVEMDEIHWKWMPNGEHMTAYAYRIQFQGSHTPFQVGKLWKASVESKVKIFGWTAMHQRILTVDNLASRGMHHNPLCPLCNSYLEDARHLLINYPFAREVLRYIWSWFHLQGSPSVCLANQEPAN
jgi:hypothetical protein